MLAGLVVALSFVVAPDLRAQERGGVPFLKPVAGPTGPVERKAIRMAKALSFTPDREAAARSFVARHHVELGGLLDRLSAANRPEYERAIVELFQVSESLAELQGRDPKRYELARDAWQARSRVQVLTARLSGENDPELVSQLRTAIEGQLDVELRRQRHELELAEARARRSREAIDRLERNRKQLVDNRVRNSLKSSRRARDAARNRNAPTETETSNAEEKD